MSRTFTRADAADELDLFLSSINDPSDLYFIDGETAFRRCGGTIETFDAERAYTGGQP